MMWNLSSLPSRHLGCASLTPGRLTSTRWRHCTTPKQIVSLISPYHCAKSSAAKEYRTRSSTRSAVTRNVKLVDLRAYAVASRRIAASASVAVRSTESPDDDDVAAAATSAKEAWYNQRRTYRHVVARVRSFGAGRSILIKQIQGHYGGQLTVF
jgi:hypothetical protein